MRFIFVASTLLPMLAFADCTQNGKTALDEMLYMDKEELITLHCSASKSEKLYTDYQIKLMQLGVFGGADYDEAQKNSAACGADKKMTTRVLRKDHDYVVSEDTCGPLGDSPF